MATAEPMVADLRAESDDLDALVADLPDALVGRADARAGLDDRPSDRAPAVDRPRRADRGHRRGRLRRVADRGRARTRPGSSTPAPRSWLRVPPDRPAGRLAPHPRPAARRAAGRRRRPQAAVVRPADECGVDGDRAADGDLGARPRRRRRARREAARRPRGCDRSRTSACAPAISRSPSTDCTPPPEPFRVELRAPDGTTWSWGPDDAAQRVTGSAEDFCMLVTQRRPRADLDVTAVGDGRRDSGWALRRRSPGRRVLDVSAQAGYPHFGSEPDGR